MALVGIEALLVLAYRRAEPKTADAADFHVRAALGWSDDNFSPLILPSGIDDDNKSSCPEETQKVKPSARLSMRRRRSRHMGGGR